MSVSKMLVTPELILQALGFPKKTRIVGVESEWPHRDITFFVEHPDIPEDSVTVTPQFVTHYAEGCNHVVRVEMIDWGSRDW